MALSEHVVHQTHTHTKSESIIIKKNHISIHHQKWDSSFQTEPTYFGPLLLFSNSLEGSGDRRDPPVLEHLQKEILFIKSGSGEGRKASVNDLQRSIRNSKYRVSSNQTEQWKIPHQYGGFNRKTMEKLIIHYRRVIYESYLRTKLANAGPTESLCPHLAARFIAASAALLCLDLYSSAANTVRCRRNHDLTNFVGLKNCV